MRKAKVGDEVGIYFDGRPVFEGQALRTPTGRTYLIVRRRVQQRGKHRGRQHLRCVIVDETPDGAVIVPLVWYPRSRKRL